MSGTNISSQICQMEDEQLRKMQGEFQATLSQQTIVHHRDRGLSILQYKFA
jgi:hypothetical protein